MHLAIEHVTLRFGGVTALSDVSFTVAEGEVCGLVGPNGAGKSSLFNCINGLYLPREGRILFEGHDLAGRPPHRIARLGVGRTFQNLAFSPSLTLLENVMLTGVVHDGLHPLACLVGSPWQRRRDRALRSRATDLLEQFDLLHAARRLPGELPFGTLKRAEIARALLARPRLLLVDEPAGGLNHQEVDELAALLRQVREDSGTTIVLVEHNMGFVMSLVDRVVVLDGGRKIADDVPDVVSKDPVVIEAYLGAPA